MERSSVTARGYVAHCRARRWLTAASLLLATLGGAGVGAASAMPVQEDARRAAAVEADRTVVGDELRSAVGTLAAGERLPVIVEFEAPPVARVAFPPGVDVVPGDLVSSLKARASAALSGLDDLAGPNEGGAGEAVGGDDLRLTERFWIVPAAAAEVTAIGLERLAAAPGVRRIVPDRELPVALEPAVRSVAPPSFTSDAMRTIGADAVWDDGATGDGVVVAFFDSGVDATNAMLARRWRGLRTSTRASWFDPFRRASTPQDFIGHGTQVAVAAVGALGAGDTLEMADGSTLVASEDIDVVTGTAPRAEWIAARVFENFGGGVFTRRSVLLQAFQWALDPDGNPGTSDAPDVINNSWGILPTGDFDLCTDVLYDAIDAAEAAGIAVLFSAGNAGPSPGSVAFPAARSDAQLRSFAVGASSGTTTIDVAAFSGRGPSPCGGGIKPDLIAPGTVPEVRADGAGRARLTGFTVQGTSYSVAQVSGALALLRQQQSGATPEELKRLLLDTAEDVGPPGPDNDAGSGLLDVPGALSAAGFTLNGRLLTVAGAAVDAEALTIRLRNRGGDVWPGGELRIEPVPLGGRWAGAGGAKPARAVLPPIRGGEVVAARLAWEESAPEGRTAVRVVVTEASGRIALSQLVLADPPDDFGGFVLTAGALAAGANDFGRLGRIAAPQGFAWQGEELLPAGGIGVAVGQVLSDGFYATTLGRHDIKVFGPAAETDWAPQRGATDVGPARADVRFDDFEALVPALVEVSGVYEASEEGGVGALGAVLTVRNRGASDAADVYVALLADWELPGGESIRWVPGLEALVGEALAGDGTEPVTLLASDTTVSATVELPLGTPGTAQFYEAGSGVLADSLLDTVKLDLVRGGSPSLPGAGSALDNAALLGVGPFEVAVGATVTVRFWLLAAPDETAGAQRLEELRAEDVPPPPTDGDAFAALPPYPNPFRPGDAVVRFPYTLSDADAEAGGEISLEIYDLSGRRLLRDRRTLPPGGAAPAFTWDGRLDGGRDAASGMYLYVIRLGDETVSGRVLVVR